MGVFIRDRSSTRGGPLDPGRYAFVFWICAGIVGNGGLGICLVGYSEKVVPIFMLIGALIGGRVGSYAASAETQMVWVLALPGYPFAIFTAIIGLA